jgi:hypothetical protein
MQVKGAGKVHERSPSNYFKIEIKRGKRNHLRLR